MNKQNEKSYRQIFKSTSLVGGTKILSIAIGIFRIKALATLLGPSGVGLAGMYTSAVSLIGTISGLGISSAGVRQIAEASSSKDEYRIAKTIRTLRHTSLISGILGTIVVLLLSVPLSRLTFGKVEYASGIAIVSLTILFGGVSAGQTALLQGLRRLKDLAKCNIWGAIFGTIASIIIVYIFREKGIVWYIVAASAFTIFSSWWYARKIKIEKITIEKKEVIIEARTLLSLGVAFLISALLSSGSVYIIRVLIVRKLGIDAVGLYIATVTLSSLYVGTVLTAMGADFYPRLTEIAKDNNATNKLVNEQTEMGILMALPGIVGTLTFAPIILELFYSERFILATEIIRWQIIGVALRVISWPMGFIMLARGASKIFIFTEVIFHSLHVVLILVCLNYWGISGLGIAFFLMYCGHVGCMLLVSHHLTGFNWSKRSSKLVALSVLSVSSLFLSIKFMPSVYGLVIGICLTFALSALSFNYMQKLLGLNLFEKLVSKIA